jgi:hypothetical protein
LVLRKFVCDRGIRKGRQVARSVHRAMAALIAGRAAPVRLAARALIFYIYFDYCLLGEFSAQPIEEERARGERVKEDGMSNESGGEEGE